MPIRHSRRPKSSRPPSFATRWRPTRIPNPSSGRGRRDIANGLRRAQVAKIEALALPHRTPTCRGGNPGLPSRFLPSSCISRGRCCRRPSIERSWARRTGPSGNLRARGVEPIHLGNLVLLARHANNLRHRRSPHPAMDRNSSFDIVAYSPAPRLDSVPWISQLALRCGRDCPGGRRHQLTQEPGTPGYVWLPASMAIL